MNRWVKGGLALTGTAIFIWSTSGQSILATAVAVAATGIWLFARWTSNPNPDKTRYGETLRGTQVSDKKSRRFKSANDQISIGGIPIAREVEPQHLLAVGGPGTGKSVLVEAVLDTVRARGQRAVVYDPTDEFISHYYRPDHDAILSPIDKRSALWSP